ncbi:hypothetical protein [Nibricoccus sp. IMCC34717]|uniref:hypothetical protein n=1 Tax=Nibricoccus sp. IMCC34717 TaxID=3034021 RepID=UPI0038513217
MSPRELSQKHPFPVFGLITAVVLIGFGVYRNLSVPDLEAERDSISKDAVRIHNNVVNSASLAEQVKAITELNAAVNSRLARVNDLAGNTQFFYKIEAETGVRESALSPVVLTTKRPPGSLFTSVAFNCAVEGRFPQILAFLDRLEGASWYGRVLTLNLRQLVQTDSRSEPQLAANLTVEILAQP